MSKPLKFKEKIGNQVNHPNRIISELNSIRNQNSTDGVGFAEPRFSYFSGILTPLIEGFPSGIAAFDRPGILKKAILRAGQSGPLSPDSILSKLRQECSNAVGRPRKFVLATSISLDNGKFLTHRIIDKVRITFPSKLPESFISSRDEIIDEQKENLSEVSLVNKFVPVKVFISALSETEAMERSLDALEFLRAIWNLCLNKNKHLNFFSTGSEVINSVVLGRIHTIHHTDGRIAGTRFFREDNFPYPPKLLKADRLSTGLTEFERQTRKMIMESKNGTVLRDSMIRYSKALDLSNYSIGFPLLWSILEALTFSLNDNYDVTVKRAASILPDRKLHTQILNTLRETRNQVVHTGLSSDRDNLFSLTHWLKFYIEELLFFHLRRSKVFRNREETIFVLNQSSNVSKLKRNIELTESLLEYWQ